MPHKSGYGKDNTPRKTPTRTPAKKPANSRVPAKRPANTIGKKNKADPGSSGRRNKKSYRPMDS